MSNEKKTASQTALIFAPDEPDTGKIGSLLAKIVNQGDLVLFAGDLGAGKTALARALIRSLLKTPELEVPSPTFLLVLPYQGQGWSILHADLYRLNEPEELDELGLDDNPNALVLIEWAQRAPELESRADLIISLEIPDDGTGRRINIKSVNGQHDLSVFFPEFSGG
ncbi:tRNA threonylcarbamoyladenosine biosynthesis protein TsaE / Phosphotransferase involved in threonylcarbamoyladenosine t(6)A37 formation in tRNA [hydrothermal vent metagenome]|uniref:tRNA threonylcarbamoyladenosine biosynthesis protein TsaE n=1 Tax=hydrothermal vent metagenome TaxID=652676 RepID=A0A3B0TPJ7_9ZZZZ